MSKFLVSGDSIYVDNTKKILKSGFPSDVYTVQVQRMSGMITVDSMEVHSDTLVDLPNSSYSTVLNEMVTFFETSTKNKFKDYGFLYKNSILLYGAPGTGKTCLAVKLIDVFLERFKNGIVFFNPNLGGVNTLTTGKQIKSDVPVFIVFEEFDNTVMQYREADILSLLDGESQRPNTFYLFTTNYINKIPKRLFRPGRIANTVEVKNPSYEARLHYLKTKLPEESPDVLHNWALLTKDLNLDDLKQTVLAVKCLNQNLMTVIDKLKEQHQYLDQYATETQQNTEDEDEDMFN